jgi:predicted RNase H-like nuclease (RuvC/YqgF family)
MSDDSYSLSAVSYQKIIQALQEENQHLKNTIERLTEKIVKLIAELSKFTFLHIPTSKQIYPNIIKARSIPPVLRTLHLRGEDGAFEN